MSDLVASPESLVLFQNSQGFSGRGTLLHLTRHTVALEVYNPYSIVQLSEVLNDFRILRNGHAIYHGRAVVTTLVPTGAITIVSAQLLDPWSDLSGNLEPDAVREEMARFVTGWTQNARLRPGYQLAVNNLANFLDELNRWLGQAETLYSEEVGLDQDRSLFSEVWPELEGKLDELFSAFEREACEVSSEEVAVHKAFAQRALHPLVMCDPFTHRIFTKPLGYAGDYGMVNMILGGAGAVTSTYARVVSAFCLSRAPAVAHRNRVERLELLLRQEARRLSGTGARLRVLNVGCGPATEVERFLAHGAEAHGARLTLVDFNEETLAFASSRIERARATGHVDSEVVTVHQSIHDLLKAAASGESALASQYDFVYCAGLFDYLSDRVCKRLMRLFCDWTAPGGLAVATNVHSRNPFRHYMSQIAEWYLEYRDEAQFLSFAAPGLGADVLADATGVNLFLEQRRPSA